MTIKEAFDNGYQAGLAGYTGYNPYKPDTPEREAWYNGYEAAVRELKKSVKGT